MKGDFSRKTFDPRKHYSNVLMQQGRVQIDADWNEQGAIQAYRRRVAVGDLIGLCGGPKGKDSNGVDLAGFKISCDQNELGVSRGRYYVNGILCENEGDLKVTKTGQTPQTGVSSISYPPQGQHLVYLDVWERHVNSLEDNEIREIALGGPDTCTRSQVAWEIRIAKDVQGQTCADFQDWKPAGIPSTGRMKARLKRTGTPTGPCEVSGGEYHRLENQLYRVEIHQGGSADSATFKWSRDNGSITAIWSKAQNDGKVLTLKDPTAQQLQGFSGTPWVEITDELRERQGKQGVLAQVKSLDDHVLTLEPTSIKDPDDAKASSVDKTKFNDRPIIRRWDSIADLSLVGPANQGVWIELEEDIQVFFDDQGSYRTGDFWLVPSRMLIDDVLWPVDGNGNPEFTKEHGVVHHYCPLALLTLSGNGVQVKDCRKFFPPATAITADDVSFDGKTCEMDGVNTVQEAIDTLCQRDGGMCTLIALPGPGWEKVFDHLPQGKDAQICFKAGEYPYNGKEPITIKGKGAIHLRLSGIGQGTRLIAKECESVLAFQGCESVTVRDLYAESKAAGKTGKLKNLNGVLTFLDIPHVTVENTNLRCRSGARRMATCITVRISESALKGRAQHANVRIRHNNLQVGHLQTGILLVNAARVQVEDNTLAVVKKPGWLSLKHMLTDDYYRGNVVRALMNEMIVKEASNPGPNPGSGSERTTFSFGDFEMEFEEERSYTEELASDLMGNLPSMESIRSSTELESELNSVVNNILRNPEKVEAMPGVKKWLERLKKKNIAVGSQGVVVGGHWAEDVRIIHNTIHGMLQGIHVGQSRAIEDRESDVLDRTMRLQILHNTITVLMPVILPHERHGIFCGNCESLVIENNFLRIKRYKETLETNIDGIRVFGTMGRMMKVCQNHVEHPTVGFYFNPLNSPIKQIPKSLWLFGENMVVDPLSGESVEVGDRPQQGETAAQKARRLQRNQKKRVLLTTYRNWP